MTKDFNKRDQLLFGQDYDEDMYGGGIRRFDGLWAVDARELIKLGFLNPHDAQNYSPTAEEFIRFMESGVGHPITAHGYAVSQQRGDCRVTIEGIEYACAETMSWDQIEAFLTFRHADEFELDEHRFYCWYD